MKTLIIAFALLFSVNAFAKQETVTVVYHGKPTIALGVTRGPSGWVVTAPVRANLPRSEVNNPKTCVVSPTTVTDVTEGYGPVDVAAAKCGQHKLYLNGDKFVVGHIYRDADGRLIYLME